MKIFIASPQVIRGKPINAIIYIQDVWLLLNQEEINNEHSYDHNNFELYGEEKVYERIPALKGNLDESQETFVFINEKTGEINFNPKHKHLGFSTADEARATNQANVQISIIKYLLNKKKYSLKVSLAIVLLILLCFTISWIFIFYLIRILFLHVFSILSQRNMCLSGTLNPGIVLNTNPTRIAVLTDLSMWSGNYPLVRVKKVELPKKYNFKNAKIPIAGSYQNVENQSFWDYFDPIPIPLGIKNEEDVPKKINEIPVYDWISLLQNLKTMTDDQKEGYYPIEIETSSWKDIDNPRFTQFNEENKNDL